MKRLHELYPEGGSIHIDVASAQTGISRFAEMCSTATTSDDMNDIWLYSKDEGLINPVRKFEIFMVTFYVKCKKYSLILYNLCFFFTRLIIKNLTTW